MRGAAIITVVIAWAIPALADNCPINFPTDVTYLAASAQSDRRVYLFPGLDVNVSADFGEGPLKEMVNRLRAGADVVLVPLPVPTACIFDHGGERYRQRFTATLRALVIAMDAAHGARLNIAGGVSYGGLHAMMAAATVDRFSGWFAMLPVVRLDALAEFPDLDVPRFNPLNEAAALSRLPGFLTWGTADDRVNWHLTAQLADRIMGENIHVIEYPSQPHETRPHNIADLMEWISMR